MRVAEPKATLAGLSLFGVAVTMLEILWIRLLAALFGHDVAFAAAVLALLALGAGAVLPTVFPGIAATPKVPARVAMLGVAAGAAAVLGIIFLTHLTHLKEGATFALGFGEVPSASGRMRLGILVSLGIAPFGLSGVAWALVVQRNIHRVSVVSFAQLLGVSLGSLASVMAMRSGAPRAVLVVGIVFAVAALVFSLSAERGLERSLSNGVGPAGLTVQIAATFLLGVAAVLVGEIGAPWLKPRMSHSTTPEKVEFERWSDAGLVSVERARGTLWIRVDGERQSALVDGTKEPPPVPEDLAYVLHRGGGGEHAGPRGPILIIEAGGGRAIRAARKAGHDDVLALVQNPTIARDVLRGEFRRGTDDVYDEVGVTLSVAEGRSLLQRTDTVFDSIVVLAASPASDPLARLRLGMLGAPQAGLHTHEAYAEYLDHLSEQGVLVVTMPETHLDEGIAAASSALRRRSAKHVEKHLYACSKDAESALLASKVEFAAGELRALRKACKQKKFAESFTSHDGRIAKDGKPPAADATAVVSAAVLDDDRPFLSGDAFTSSVRVAIQWLLVALSGLLIAIVVPLLVRPGDIVRSHHAWQPVRVALALPLFGFAVVVCEIAVLRQFTQLLGHTSYALSVVVPVWALSLGLGSLLTDGTKTSRAAHVVTVRAAIAFSLVAGLAIGFGAGGSAISALPLAPRLALLLGALTLIGAVLGSQIPLGLRLAGSLSVRLVPWSLGLMLVGQVVGATLATVLALRFGFRFLPVLGGVFALVGALMLPRTPRAITSEPA